MRCSGARLRERRGDVSDWAWAREQQREERPGSVRCERSDSGAGNLAHRRARPVRERLHGMDAVTRGLGCGGAWGSARRQRASSRNFVLRRYVAATIQARRLSHNSATGRRLRAGKGDPGARVLPSRSAWTSSELRTGPIHVPAASIPPPDSIGQATKITRGRQDAPAARRPETDQGRLGAC